MGVENGVCFLLVNTALTRAWKGKSFGELCRLNLLGSTKGCQRKLGEEEENAGNSPHSSSRRPRETFPIPGCPSCLSPPWPSTAYARLFLVAIVAALVKYCQCFTVCLGNRTRVAARLHAGHSTSGDVGKFPVLLTSAGPCCGWDSWLPGIEFLRECSGRSSKPELS